MPYAMVVYSKNDHAFVDQDYLRQTKQLEAALMLKVARAQRQTGGHDKWADPHAGPYFGRQPKCHGHPTPFNLKKWMRTTATC